MYKLYIDESGVPELSSHDKHCILGGILLNEQDEKAICFIIQNIKEKFHLELQRHIHAVDIFEDKGKNCYLGKTKKRRKNDLRKRFQKDIWDVLKRYKIKYFAVTVKKDFVRKSLGLTKTHDKGNLWINSANFYARIDRQLPMDVGVNAIYYWALKQIKKDDKLKIVFESRSGDLFSNRNLSHISQKEVFKDKWMRIFSDNIKNKVVSIAFENKDAMATGLELADIVGYTCNIYFLQIKKKGKHISETLRKAVCFDGIHKTLNKKHYTELSQRVVKKYIAGLNPRTKRISEFYSGTL